MKRAAPRLLALVIPFMVLSGCLRLTRDNDPVSPKLTVLVGDLASLRRVIQELSDGKTAVDQRVGGKGVCAGVVAVGSALTTDERPGGTLGVAWQHAQAAQRSLQLACGEVRVRLLGSEQAGNPQRGADRLALASMHLDRACRELNAAARELGRPDYRC